MRGRTDSIKIHHALGASKAEPGHRVPAYAQAIDLGAARKDPISRLRGVATNGLRLSCVARCGCARRPGRVEAIGFDPIAGSRRGSCRGFKSSRAASWPGPFIPRRRKSR